MLTAAQGTQRVCAPVARTQRRSRKGTHSSKVAVPNASLRPSLGDAASAAAAAAVASGSIGTLPASAASEAAAVAYGPAGANDNFYAAIATVLFIGVATAFLILLYVKSRYENNVSGGFNRKYFEQKEGVPSAVESEKKGKR